MSSPKPAVLIVIDGWGVRDEEYGNAIMKADTPVAARLLPTLPWSTTGSCTELLPRLARR